LIVRQLCKPSVSGAFSTQASKTLRNIRSIYVKELTAEFENGKISNYRINANVAFDLEHGK
jgi:dodecin